MLVKVHSFPHPAFSVVLAGAALYCLLSRALHYSYTASQKANPNPAFPCTRLYTRDATKSLSAGLFNSTSLRRAIVPLSATFRPTLRFPPQDLTKPSTSDGTTNEAITNAPQLQHALLSKYGPNLNKIRSMAYTGARFANASSIAPELSQFDREYQ
jgi:hypothetical protein